MKKLFNLAKELVRITKVIFSPDHFKMYSRIHGLKDWNGEPSFRVVEFTVWSPWSERLMAKRDHLDVVIDTVRDIARSYRNSVLWSLCTHPEKDVWVEIQGDDEYGFCKQYICSKCGGHLDKEEIVDRYDGGTIAIKYAARPYAIPRGYFPSKEDKEIWNLENVEFPLYMNTLYSELVPPADLSHQACKESNRQFAILS